MRAKSDKPGDPVKELQGTVGNVAPDMFPEINEEQQTIIPRSLMFNRNNQPECLR